MLNNCIDPNSDEFRKICKIGVAKTINLRIVYIDCVGVQESR